MVRYDVCVVGAGLVGLGVAQAVHRRFPGASVLVLDKEPEVAAHQSSHNSGVLHSGLYYRPGSLKARLCVSGRRAMSELCAEHGIPLDESGKLVVATSPSQLGALDELERRGRANGLIGLKRIGRDEIPDFEPRASGIAALHVPEAGVVDYPAVAQAHVDSLTSAGAVIRTSAPVTAITHKVDGVEVIAGEERFETGVMVNCAGLQSDRVAALAGIDPPVRIVPFRGEYYRLSDQASDLAKGLIYPVPDPRFPFLGVHFTRRIDGSVEVGPNAVMALGREHYRHVPPDWREVAGTLAYGGFRRLAMRHWWSGAKEMVNSRSRSLYARLARRLVPALQARDLMPGGVGVRAQAVDARGNLVDDFVIETAGHSVHVLNAPSPGATASIAIGNEIADQLAPLLDARTRRGV